MAGNISEGFTNLSNISIQGGGPAGTTSGQTVALNGAFLSLGTWAFSITTASSALAVPSGSLGLVFRASGVSLVYVSGSTVYSVASSTVSGTA